MADQEELVRPGAGALMSNTTLAPQAGEIFGHEYDSYRAGVSSAVAAELAAAKIPASAAAIDAAYNQAWFGVYARCHAGEPVGLHEGLLTEIAQRRVIDEYRIGNPEHRLDFAVLEAVGIADPIEESAERQRALNEFSEELRSRYNQWELQSVVLNQVFEFPLAQAASKVGVNPERMERVMADVTTALNAALESTEAGEPCGDRPALINQFAFGLFGPRTDEYRDAISHLKACPDCRRHVMGARAMTAVTISSRAVVVALTGGLAAGAPRAASPLQTASRAERAALPARRASDARSKPERHRLGSFVMVAAVLAVSFALSSVIDREGKIAAATAQASTQAAAIAKLEVAKAKAAEAKAAKDKREERAAKKRRAEKRDRARARARARARSRAAARRRSAAARQNASATAPAQTQLPAQTTPQVQQQPTKAPTQSKPAPAPSTDPTQEFDVK
jgi:hypothetical protein